MAQTTASVARVFTSPEATRMVAGGPSEASDHRTSLRAFHRPRRGRGGVSRRLVFLTRPLPGSVLHSRLFPVVARFARTTGYRTSHLWWLSLMAVAFLVLGCHREPRQKAETPPS